MQSEDWSAGSAKHKNDLKVRSGCRQKRCRTKGFMLDNHGAPCKEDLRGSFPNECTPCLVSGKHKQVGTIH